MFTTLLWLFVLAGCSGAGETGLTYEQFQQKVLGFSGGIYKTEHELTLAQYKEFLGPPEREVAYGRTYELYYRVREGQVQVVLERYVGDSYMLMGFRLNP